MAEISGETREVLDVTEAALRRAVGRAFRIEREIGRGGMGVVYLAHDEQLHRMVALKTLPPHLSADPLVRSRFLREARTAAGLSHPNIVPIFSAAERDEVVYFAMGFVDGESLAERIARSGPLSPIELVRLLDELAAALGAAHARGVVHRDVKAENVLLDRITGRAMVTDFGIARVTEAQPMTATGTVLGTVHYMSPEQVSGDTLDGRSDLYSLGVLAFFALTGRFPFERATASAVVVAHVNANPPRLREIWPACPPVLEELVARLLAKSPRDRFADADALRAALRDAERQALERTDVDVAIPGTNATERAVLSSREAQEIWSRAAELQANTGMITPPPRFAPPTQGDRLTSGYDAALVQASAVDAGIDEKYVERAMLERQAAAQIDVVRGESMQKSPNILLGAHTKIELSAGFDGEIDSEAFEDVADVARAALGEMVTISAVGRTLTINTGIGTARPGTNARMVQIQMSSRNGRTQVRIFEDLTQISAGLFLGGGLGGGVAAISLVGGLVGKATHSPPLVIASIVASASLVLLLSRTLFKRIHRKKHNELEVVLRRIIDRARQSMLEKQQNKKLPR